HAEQCRICGMPYLNSHRVHHRLAEVGLTVKELADRCGIRYGTMRNAVFGHDPISLHRAYRVLDAINPPGRARLLIDDVLAEAAQKPTEPRERPSGRKSPRRRQDEETEKKAPKRLHDEAVA